MQSTIGETGNVTASEAASILRITHRGTLRAIKEGRLRAATKLPGRSGPYLIALDEVRRFDRVRKSGRHPSGKALASDPAEQKTAS